MNAKTSFYIHAPSPQINSLEIVSNGVVRVRWVAGSRTGRTDNVDLSPLIQSFKYYRPIREWSIFCKAEIIDDGFAVAWNEDIEIASTAIERLAEEIFSSDDFKTFLAQYGLTHAEAAARLGKSRRTIENYLSGAEPIPRTFVLACYGLVFRQQTPRFSLATPTQTSFGKVFNVKRGERLIASTTVIEVPRLKNLFAESTQVKSTALAASTTSEG